MGSPDKRHHKTPVRSILIASGAAVVVLMAAAGALAAVTTGGSPGSATAAHMAPSATKAQTDPSQAVPSPSGTRVTPPQLSPTRSTHKPKAKPSSGESKKAESKKKPAYRVVKSGSCEASYYWEGQMTASGEPFDPSALTAAHRTLPMDSKVRVINKNNGRSVIVRINDRGPFTGGRCLDLSTAAMKKVRGTGAGVIPVRYEVLKRT